jgi:hypothetical protein
VATFNINEVARRAQYTSTGQDGPYAFNFQVNAASELQVYRNDDLQTDSTHYNATVGADGTGSITFIDNSGSGGTDHTPVNGDLITIIGDQPLSRTTVFQVGQTNNPTTLETEFDNVVIRQQQLKEMMDRSIQLKPSTPRTVTGSGTSGPLLFPYDATVANNKNKLISYDNNGTSLVTTSEIGSFKGDWSASTSYFQRDIVKDTSTNNIFIANTDHTSSGSEPLTTNTDSAKWDLLVDAASATSSATAAANSATAAAASAVDATNNGAAQVTLATAQVALATTQANNAATSATASEASRQASETAQTAAEAAQAAAELAQNSFDGTYLGAKSSDPTTDNDGGSLAVGMLYFNTGSNNLRVYNGTIWEDAAVSTNGFAQNGFAIAMAVAL